MNDNSHVVRKRILATISSAFMANTLFAATPHLTHFSQSSDYELLGNSVTQSFQSENTALQFKHSQHRFLGEENAENISSIHYSFGQPGRKYHAAFNHGANERNAVLGYSFADFTLSTIAGKSQSFVRDSGSFSNLSRFGLHGGNNIGFDFHGVGLDKKLKGGVHTQIGFAKLNSNFEGVESRGTRYFELSSSSSPFENLTGLYSRFSVIDRGDTQIGRSFEVGVNYKQAQFMLQGISTGNNKRLTRLRTQFTVNHASNITFDLSHARDPLHFNESRYTALISFQHIFGTKSQIAFGLKEDEAAATKGKKSRINRPVLIGAGVVAGVAIASSGSDSTDSSMRTQAETDAAFAVLNRINPTSVAQNREFGGWIYRNQDNTYGSSTPVRGEAASLTLPNPAASTPAGSRVTASYHTHAAFDPRFDNENFSPTDISTDNRLGIGGYLATPGGTFQYHFGNNIQLLGRIAN